MAKEDITLIHRARSFHPYYWLWHSMKKRCDLKTDKNYHRYGARGIKLCKEWYDFSQFINDMGQRPTRKHSIDRINNDGNYEPSNCRWATPWQQSRNKRKPPTSRYRGVCLNHGKWQAVCNGKYLGLYPTEIEAYKVVKKFLSEASK